MSWLKSWFMIFGPLIRDKYVYMHTYIHSYICMYIRAQVHKKWIMAKVVRKLVSWRTIWKWMGQVVPKLANGHIGYPDDAQEHKTPLPPRTFFNFPPFLFPSKISTGPTQSSPRYLHASYLCLRYHDYIIQCLLNPYTLSPVFETRLIVVVVVVIVVIAWWSWSSRRLHGYDPDNVKTSYLATWTRSKRLHLHKVCRHLVATLLISLIKTYLTIPL